MLAHLCRLAWNRRRTYLLLVGELFLSFLVFTLLVAGWVLFTIENSKPLGFEAEDLWIVSVQDRDFGRNQDDNAKAMIRRSIELTGMELRALDEVQGVAQVSSPPFSISFGKRDRFRFYFGRGSRGFGAAATQRALVPARRRRLKLVDSRH